MAQIITIGNQKGGVAKTTTAWAMATGLHARGYKVLAVDLDPQSNLSSAFGADRNADITAYEMMKGEAKATDAIQKTKSCDMIAAPINTELARIEQEVTQPGKEYRLKEQLEDVLNRYDYIVIDTPPNLGMLTVCAFTAANKIIIPTVSGTFSMDGILELDKTISSVKKYCNPQLIVAGILSTQCNPQARFHKSMREVANGLAKRMNTKLYDTFIRRGVAIEEAQAETTSIFEYSKTSTVADDYNSFIDEFLKEDR